MVDFRDVEKALNALETGADRRYFYQNISSPEWIAPLLDAGVFNTVPEPIREGDYIQYPDWPEGEYLLRMAEDADEKEVQELILEALLRLPNTENRRADHTLTEIALELPPALAKRWASEEEQRLEDTFELPSLKAEALGKLAVRIAQGGHIKFALYFMRKVLEILPDDAEEERIRPFGRPNPEIRMERWTYGEMVREYVPTLVDLGETDTLQILLCPLLEQAIKHNLSEAEDRDYSWIWMPKIESDENAHGPRHFLTIALREAVERLAAQDSGTVPELVELLEDQGSSWSVFRRIILHLLRLYPEAVQDKAIEYALDSELLGDYRVWHEYALFIRKIFPKLDGGEKEAVIKKILVGPSLPKDVIDELTDDKIQKRIDNWKLRRLSLLEEHLAGSAAEEYEVLKEEYGQYSNPAEPQRGVSTGWVGPTSPKSEEELASLNPEELIEYLQNWEPPQEWRSPTPEGLGRMLASVVSENPRPFSDLADRFRTLDPTYVSSFITGLEEAEANIDWEPVLNLCEWVVSQPREAMERPLPPSIYGNDVDPDWGWTRKRIARLLRTGMAGDNLPYALRENAWSTLEVLTQDPEPTPEYEKKYGGDNMDPHTLSINTVRGEAMHAVVGYALWVRRHELGGTPDPRPGGFKTIPEAREVLDSHLDIDEDPSLAVRTVYGQWLPQLFLIDTTWTENKKEQIFPRKAEYQDYRIAAWGAYLFSNRVYDDVFATFRDEYEAAIDRLPEGASMGIRNTNERLASHLMMAYVRGEESLERDSLIPKFFAASDDDLRAHAIQWVGRQMKKFGIDEDRVPGLTDRLRNLWEYRLARADESGEEKGFEQELAAFGWWLTAGEFEVEYALTQTIRTLQNVGSIKPEVEVMEALAELSDRYPALVLQCLKHLVYADQSGPRIYGHKDNETRKILSAALEDESLQEEAKALINYLGAQGFFQFGDLLD